MARFATMILLGSLSAGTWVGLGKPPARDIPRIARTLSTHVQASKVVRQTEMFIAEPPARGLDASLLPDPTPWPRLNPAVSMHRAWLLAEGPHHPEGDGRRLVTFTFDDGPFPETTPTFLKVLARHHVKASFFWIGHYLEGDSTRAVRTREVARQVIAQGHLIGSHTYGHLRLTALSRTDVLEQIDRGSLSIENATGKRPVLFRPPYGQLDAWASERLKERGAELVLWSVEAGDMKNDDAQAIYERLLEQIQYAGGGIVLLHDIRWASATALEKLLTWLDRHPWDPSRPDAVGYEVTDLPGYLRATGASPQPYEDRASLEFARQEAWRREHPARGVPSVDPASTNTEGI